MTDSNHPGLNRPKGGRRIEWLEQKPLGRKVGQNARRQRRLRRLKIILPVAALLCLGLILLWPRFSDRISSFQLSFNQQDVSDDDLLLLNPRFHGSDNRGQPYMLAAAKARQDKDDARLVHLEKLRADMTMEDGGWLTITADTGLYNQETRILTVAGNLYAITDQGYEARGQEAIVILDERRAKTDKPIIMKGAAGVLQAGAAEFFFDSKRILFSNRVKMRIEPAALKRRSP